MPRAARRPFSPLLSCSVFSFSHCIGTLRLGVPLPTSVGDFFGRQGLIDWSPLPHALAHAFRVDCLTLMCTGHTCLMCTGHACCIYSCVDCARVPALIAGGAPCPALRKEPSKTLGVVACKRTPAHIIASVCDLHFDIYPPN